MVRDKAYLEVAKVFDAQLEERTIHCLPRLQEQLGGFAGGKKEKSKDRFSLLMIIGPSGSGKSSLGQSMFGVHPSGVLQGVA